MRLSRPRSRTVDASATSSRRSAQQRASPGFACDRLADQAGALGTIPAQALSREALLSHKARIVALLAEMRLELSKFTLARVTRGVNFVGYRTWASRRFVRKHALYVFRQSIKSGQVESLVSSLGHALRTHSLRHMLRTLKEKDHALYRQLPEVFRRVHLA